MTAETCETCSKFERRFSECAALRGLLKCRVCGELFAPDGASVFHCGALPRPDVWDIADPQNPPPECPGHEPKPEPEKQQTVLF